MIQTAQLTALKGLFVGQSALGEKKDDLAALLDLVLPLVDQVTKADGGHKSRMPDMHLKLLRDLVEIRYTASSSGVDIITKLDKKIAQMASICRMWRHADGQFARFNGAGMMAIETIEETLARAGHRGKSFAKGPLQRLYPIFIWPIHRHYGLRITTNQRGHHRLRYIGI